MEAAEVATPTPSVRTYIPRSRARSCAEDSSRVRCMARLSLIATSRRNRSVSMASVEHEARRRRAEESSDILAAPLNTHSREQAKQSAFFFPSSAASFIGTLCI